MRVVMCLFALAVSVCSFRSVAAEENGVVSIGSSRTIRSEVLNEERVLHVYLPQSYKDSHRYRRYPVLYVRDGGKFFHSFTGVVEQLTTDATPHAPEMIVVAIVEKDRVRDSSVTHSLKGFTGKDESDYESSGGGERFLRFLDEELIPYIDRSFSTSSYRIYCGYSFTGLSVVEALFGARSLFDAYIAIDPSWWWDDYVAERRAKAALKTRKLERVQLFMATTGERFPTNYFIKSRDIESLKTMLEEGRPAGIEWGFKRYDDETHHSMPQLALYDGLSYIFRGYKPTLEELYNDPEALRKRYQTVSERLGDKMVPSEGLLNSFGYQFLYQLKEPEKARRYFEMNAEYYPESANVWDSLGEAYSVLGDKVMAVTMYEKALLLEPGNENIAKRLTELRGGS